MPRAVAVRIEYILILVHERLRKVGTALGLGILLIPWLHRNMSIIGMTVASPRQAVEILMAMSGQVDITVLQAFLNSMILYPVDSIVMLSNGDVAKVVRRIPGFITRPMVVSVTSGKVYDLSSKNYQNIVIVD